MQELGWDRGRDDPSALAFKRHSHVLQPDPDMLRGAVKEDAEYATISPCKEWGNEEKRVSTLKQGCPYSAPEVDGDPYRKQLLGVVWSGPTGKLPHQEQPMAKCSHLHPV